MAQIQIIIVCLVDCGYKLELFLNTLVSGYYLDAL
jgi:hypothetical protein